MQSPTATEPCRPEANPCHPEVSKDGRAPSRPSPAIIDHYRLVGPIMEQLFGRIPIVWTTPTNDPAQPHKFHQKFFGHYSHLSSDHLQHLVSIGALEFYSWFSLPEDETRARYARFLLERIGDPTEDQIRETAPLLREVLAEEGVQSIPLLIGAGNIALFVPLEAGPAYPDVRAWCHEIAHKAIQCYPDKFSENPNTHEDARVHIHVSTNAVGRFSIMPYSMRAPDGTVATPIRWEELATCNMNGVSIADFPARLASAGEIFGELRASTKPFNIPSPRMMSASEPHTKRVWNNAKGALLSAVVDVLSDGKPRTCDEILAEGKAAGTIDPKTDSRALYIDLTQNIAREKGRGHKPLIVEDPDRRFRINEPLDAWPIEPIAPAPPPSPAIQAVIDRLHATSHGDDPTAFEIAVCDAFTALGFLATHLGGVGNPDGYIDAPLGVLGYRMMLECKSGHDIQKDQMVFEAAKYKDVYRAQYCILVGPDFGQRYDIVSELQTHGVCAWSLDALIMALTIGANPFEIKGALDPGFAEDRVNDILWQRNHGEAKHVRIVAEIIRKVGWLSQTLAAQAHTPTDAPLLTEDAAMLIVDQELAAQNAHVNCTREEVRLAFEWLTNPLNGAAVWNAEKTAIVITEEAR